MPTGRASLMPALRRVVLAGTDADRSDGQLLGAFVADRDADAFALLVRRHGPMVLGVCRRVITDHHAAEDAFQAVFLVLARRAAAVKPREQVGNWLYGVAYRTALKARAVLARRRGREKQVEAMPEPPPQPTPEDWADLQPVIDEELARLPEKLRAPVVLCDLEGRSQRDVAKQLGVPPATLATRLASARRTLAQRLAKRGVALSGGAVASLLTSHAASAAVPPALTHALARAAEALAAGGACSGLVSAGAVQLSEGVVRMMLLSKLKTVAVVALAAAALTGGLGLGLVPARAGGPGDDPTPAPGATTKAAPAAPATIPPAEVLDLEVALDEQNFDVLKPADDATFLRRLSLDLRGTVPTDIETYFFVADEDDGKRAKVVEWLLDDGDAKQYVARLAGVPAGRARLVQLKTPEGKPGVIVLMVEADEEKTQARPQTMAFSPDGKRLAIEVQVEKDATDGKGVVRQRVVQLGGEKQIRIFTDEDVVVPAPAQGLFQPFPAGPQGRRVFVYGAGDDKDVRIWDAKPVQARTAESDLDFLKRVTTAARGTAPTALEERYFTEDKDPNKREKLIDSLLKEPAVAKKLGDDFKKRMLPSGPGGATRRTELRWVLPSDPKQGHFELKLDPKNFQFKPGQFELKLDPKNFQFKPGEPFQFTIPVQPGKPQPKPPVPAKPAEGGLRFTIPVDPKTGELGSPVIPSPPKPPVPPTPSKPPVPPSPPKATFKVVPVPPQPPAPPAPQQPQADKLAKLVDALLAAKKSDAEILEAITLAVATRLPTDVEKRLTLGLVAKASDRKAAWLEVAKAMAGDVGEKRIEIRLAPAK